MPYVSSNIMPSDDPFAAGPSAGDRFAQRRTAPRYSLAWAVEVFEPIDRTRLTAETTVVSVKGCRVGTLNQLEPGTIVRLRIQREHETVEVWARVTGMSADDGMGFAFFANRNQELITRWIRDENQAALGA
jgi:hypothetical protein